MTADKKNQTSKTEQPSLPGKKPVLKLPLNLLKQLIKVNYPLKTWIPHRMKKKKGKTNGIGADGKLSAQLLCILIVFFVVVTITIGKPLIQKLQDPESFRSWVDGHHLWGRLAFIGMTILQVVVAIIPGEPMEIGAGYAFGAWEGMFLCLIGVDSEIARPLYTHSPVFWEYVW